MRPFVGDGPPIGMAGMGQQSLNWLAENVDGWFTYPGPPEQAQRRLDMWRTARSEAGLRDAPVLTAMHLDLQDDPDAPKEQMRLGARSDKTRLSRKSGACRRLASRTYPSRSVSPAGPWTKSWKSSRAKFFRASRSRRSW